VDVHAAVVRSFDHPPRYEPFDLPDPADGGQALVDVLAVGLHPRVRSGAAGSHYTSTGKLPMVPGIDGVGRREDGQMVYFVADEELAGPMATRTVIDTRRSIVLPDGADVVKIAAAMNPAMSAWLALRRRVPIEAGQSGRVVGAGRDQARLAALPGIGADATVALVGDADATAAALAEAASEVDLVIDYLWGKPASEAIMALLRARADRSRALNWIQIGAMAGPTIELPSVALRSANFRMQGNGQGAVSAKAYLAELPSLIDEIDSGGIAVTVRPLPLADVETVWTAPEVPGVRTVLVP
jgi:NADPH:quinone reductase-like Zn-dependent oxidoreductase